MRADEIASKLWNLCNLLRADGVTYHQYLNELTYILFLRLSEVKGFEGDIPAEYRWSALKGITDNKDLFDTYRELLATISTKSANPSIKEIYTNASTTLRKPVNLRTLVASIDAIDWFDEHEQDKIATIYEELLEKNAGEKKSEARQYFTPRPLINVMVDLVAPKVGERWNDPAAGTFGFMIAADQYLREARASVVLPDNVLFKDGDGRRIRQDLMDKCDLHTVLCLPTGIFYAAGAKTNVFFFQRAPTETGNTQQVWFYDMRTMASNYGKRTPFTR